MDINEVTLLGSIKEISNILTLKNGQQCCWLNIHTDVSFQKKDGTVGHIQDNHRAIAYGKYATVIKEKSSIDQKIFIQGRLKATSWTYNNTFFEKEFIVLERFKLYPPMQNKPKGPEDYDQRQDMVEDEPKFEEELKFNDDLVNDNGLDDYYDVVDSVELLRETGWYYPDLEDSIDNWLLENGADVTDIIFPESKKV